MNSAPAVISQLKFLADTTPIQAKFHPPWNIETERTIPRVGVGRLPK